MSEDKNKEIFDKLREFVPRAINILRVCRMITKKEFSAQLKEQPCFSSLKETIGEDICTGVYVISFEELKVICAVLGDTIEGMLKSAYRLYESEDKSDDEVQGEINTDLSYFHYLKEQGR